MKRTSQEMVLVAESMMDRLMEVRPEPATQKSRVLQADSRRRTQGGVRSGQHETSLAERVKQGGPEAVC